MTKDPAPGSIEAHIDGDVHGQVAVGNDIRQEQYVGVPRVQVTEEERQELRAAVDQLKAEVAAAAPPELRQAAIECVQELDEAVNTDEPDLSKIEYVRGWIGRHLPQIAGSITSLVFHPVLGKLVEAAGGMLADEFRRRFGSKPQT
ncbi:hypothetical protein E0H73_41045 [Kribbella pittospori]|uniref:Uncharacterized protein n=1 Tax=Kribbella pittospori TaxID=722689 RepID=A0A4R0K1A1_9ACTN|nr:hypothetical protein [Kribbella pittospori]TCC51506.1 hypothetical protein E0H73_41045 [Kribbella pittospori]